MFENAKKIEKVMNGLFNFGGKVLGKYCLNDFDTLANMDVEDIKTFQKLIKHANEVKNMAVDMAEQFDEQSKMLYDLKDEVRELREQNKEMLEILERLESKCSNEKDE